MIGEQSELLLVKEAQPKFAVTLGDSGQWRQSGFLSGNSLSPVLNIKVRMIMIKLYQNKYINVILICYKLCDFGFFNLKCLI